VREAVPKDRVLPVKTTFFLRGFLVAALACAACSSSASHAPGSASSNDDSAAREPADDAGATGNGTSADAGTDAAPTKATDTACNATDPRSTPITLSVLPDDGEKPYTDLLGAAKTSVRVWGYEMGYGATLDALVALAKAGLDVRVILDGNTQRTVNEKYSQTLIAAGAKFEWSNPAFSYMHAKTMIVDEREAVISTGNYGKTFLLQERNYTAHLTEPQDVSDLVALYDADWNGQSPNLTCTRLLVSPVNSRDRIVALVQSAQKTLYIESMQFDDRTVHDAVIARKQAGVDVQIILADAGWISTNASVAQDLAANGITARYLESPKVHVKSIIVDGAHAYLGSENISYTSLSKNREIGLIIDDAAALQSMQQTFAKDFSAATEFSTGSVDAGSD
jgi:phosphatidylserine/phosphatidylglycerophosphate/cardiolipin synthase-like enzyme